MDDCGRTSAKSRAWMMPSPPSTRPSGVRERRLSGFVREDSRRMKVFAALAPATGRWFPRALLSDQMQTADSVISAPALPSVGNRTIGGFRRPPKRPERRQQGREPNGGFNSSLGNNRSDSKRPQSCLTRMRLSAVEEQLAAGRSGLSANLNGDGP